MEIDNENEIEIQGPTQSETYHIQKNETLCHSKHAKFLVRKDFASKSTNK